MKNIIQCEQCGNDNFMTINSRKKDFGIIYRRKRCMTCGNLITTYEVHERDFEVIKCVEKEIENIRDLAMKIFGIEG